MKNRPSIASVDRKKEEEVKANLSPGSPTEVAKRNRL
jgi:hypothetical protein